MTIERDEAVHEPVGEALGAIPDWPVQWPMIFITGWWDAVFDAWQSRRCPHHASVCHDLAVPELIERDGERALFA